MSANQDNSNPLNQTCETEAACATTAKTRPAMSETQPAMSKTRPTVAEPQPAVAEPQAPQPATGEVPLWELAVSMPVDGLKRPRKSAVLPEIARLSLEGRSCREIGRRLGVPRRTVGRWISELRREWGENAAKDGVELYAIALARLETVYREAMQAWRRSLDDKLVTVEPLPGDENDDAKARGSVRRMTQSGQVTFLGQAVRAAIEISNFNAKHTYVADKARQNDRDRVRRELEDELHRIPLREFREVKKMLEKPEVFRSADELTEVLSNLPEEDYRKLYEQMLKSFVRHLPRTRPARAECEVTEKESDKESGSNGDGAHQNGQKH